jgi:hypothetical protein
MKLFQRTLIPLFFACRTFADSTPSTGGDGSAASASATGTANAVASGSESNRVSASASARPKRAVSLFPPYFAWNNNFSGREVGWHPGTEEAPQWTASFDFSTNGLYGYPASVRGWHYGFNPVGDNLFPKKVSEAGSIPCSFSYNSGGDDLHGDFAYDIFLRKDDKPAKPQLEVMVWAGNNSQPIGTVIATNIISVDGAGYDLWAGMNGPAGYFVYTFAPHEHGAKLPAEGTLDVDLADFFRLLQGREHFDPDMYVDVVEAGFEIVRGRGWVTCGWFSCDVN